eukprot:3094884-Pyramimonas_sp.AAC.1
MHHNGENNQRHKHQNSKVRADSLDRRWGPLAAPPAPSVAHRSKEPAQTPELSIFVSFAQIG